MHIVQPHPRAARRHQPIKGRVVDVVAHKADGTRPLAPQPRDGGQRDRIVAAVKDRVHDDRAGEAQRRQMGLESRDPVVETARGRVFGPARPKRKVVRTGDHVHMGVGRAGGKGCVGGVGRGDGWQGTGQDAGRGGHLFFLSGCRAGAAQLASYATTRKMVRASMATRRHIARKSGGGRQCCRGSPPRHEGGPDRRHGHPRSSGARERSPAGAVPLRAGRSRPPGGPCIRSASIKGPRERSRPRLR